MYKPPQVVIDRIEKQWDLIDGVVFRAMISKIPYIRGWSVLEDSGVIQRYNDLRGLDPKTEMQIVRYMKMIMRGKGKGMIVVDITNFPLVQCTFEEHYDPYTYNPALSQKTVPFLLINRGISLRTLRHFDL